MLSPFFIAIIEYEHALRVCLSLRGECLYGWTDALFCTNFQEDECHDR